MRLLFMILLPVLVMQLSCGDDSSTPTGPVSGNCQNCEWEVVHEGTEFHSLWSFGPNDLFAVGSRGAIFHYDGMAWVRMASGTREELWDIWGISSDDVYAVGDRNTILHYDGVTWERLETGSRRGVHNAIWGSSSDDIFVVGDDARILHYDGASWSKIETGYPTWNAPEFSAVWGSSASDVWVVGEDAIVQYDGIAAAIHEGWWTEDYYSTAFANVQGTGPDDVYVSSTGIQHWDGAEWSVFAGDLDRVYAMWVETPDNIYVVGRANYPYSNLLLFQYDGTSWHVRSNLGEVTGPAPFATPRIVLYPYRGGICVAWYDKVRRYHNDHMSTLLYRPIYGLITIVGSSDGSIFCASSAGLLQGGGDPIVWRLMEGSPTLIDLQLFSPTTIVGFDISETVWFYDGATWTSQEVGGAGTSLRCIYGFSPDNLFVAGDGGEIFHYDGTAWTEMTTPTEVDLRDIWGSSPSDIYAVSWELPILHYDGSQWSELPVSHFRPSSSVWGSSANDVYIPDEDGKLYHYDGNIWSEVASLLDTYVYGVRGSSADDVYAYGARQIMHYDGNHWIEIGGSMGGYFISRIWPWSPGDIYAITRHPDYSNFPITIHHYGPRER